MLDAGADGLDSAGTLVAEHRWDSDAARPLDRVEVRAADAAGAQLDEHLAVLWVVHLQVVVDDQRGVELMEESGSAGAHGGEYPTLCSTSGCGAARVSLTAEAHTH